MALANIYRVVQDLEGNVVTGVLGTVTVSGTATLAALYSDVDGISPLPNPTTNHAQYGSYSLFVGAGSYDMQFVKAGFTFETQRNIVLRNPTAGVDSIVGTPNRILVSPVSGIGVVQVYTPQDIAPDSWVQFFSLGLGTPASASFQLDVSGPSRFTGTLNANAVAITGGTAVLGNVQIANLGLGRTPDPSYVLAVANLPSFFAGFVGIGRVPNASFALSIGTLPSYFDTAVTINGTTHHIGIVGIQTTPNPSYALVVGTLPSYFDTAVTINGLTHHLGSVGIQRAPNASFALSVGTLPSYFDTAVTIAGMTHLTGAVGIQRVPDPAYALAVGNLPSLFQTPVTMSQTLAVSGAATVTGTLTALSRLEVGTVGGAVPADYIGLIRYPHASVYGLEFVPNVDTGSAAAINFLNAAGTSVGYILTNASTTTYATTSDVRLKHDVDDLTGELAIVEALRPIRFRWNADDSEGVGFLAHEVAALLAGVIAGEPDGMEPDGRIKPQMIDYSKLVPYVVGALKTLATRLHVVEDALGI